MNYTINQLQIFLKVVETGSVTKAAEMLHLTQPAVSIQLKNFQEQFDISLTEVVGRKIYITDFGKEIAESALQVMEQLHHIQHKTHAYKGQLFGQLKVAVVSTGKYVMPYFLSDFMTQHPNIQLHMDVSNKEKVVDALISNEIDFALVSILPTNISVEKINLLENKLFFIGRNVSTRKSSKTLLHNLDKTPLIYREQGSGTRQMMEKFLDKPSIRVQKKIELTSNEAVKQAILAGLGISIMPLIGIKNEMLNKTLTIIPTPGLPLKTNWSLVWLKGKKHSPVASAYLQFIKNEKDLIVEKHFDWYRTIVE